MKYKHKKSSVVVEAIQYQDNKIHDVMNWMEELVGNQDCLKYDPVQNRYYLKTPGGERYISNNDYIFQNIYSGSFYVYKPDTFLINYEVER